MVLIKELNKKFLVTSALPYVNNVPHLGNIIGCVLSADVFARFQRSLGRKVLYVCGTDEHGTTTEAKAREEGLSPKEICDKYFMIHKKVYDWFNISFDIFGRTSSPNHVVMTQSIFNELDKNGFIIEKITKQLYSEKSKMFLADRYVEGVCPFCGFSGARGDQCDNCGKLLTPLDLKNPVSKIDGSKPVIKETKHLFIDLEALQPELEGWVRGRSSEGFWTENAIKTTFSWFKEGLKPRAITRDLSWGVPVPKEGFEGKVFYVWFDAPIGYISITEQLLGEDWKEWWLSKDTLIFQFMAKDNIPFHTIFFPASLLGSDMGWVLPFHIDSTEYLNYEGGKFSKSRGVGVFGDDAMSTGLPADAFRYYLLINRPETSDSFFKWDDFGDRINNELVANLGNLVNRTVTFINRYFEGVVYDGGLTEDSLLFWQRLEADEQKVTDFLESAKIRDALRSIMSISKKANQYFQLREPWKKVQMGPEGEADAQETLFILANVVKDLAVLISPFMPDTANSIFRQLNITPVSWLDLGSLSLKNRQVGKPQLLFNKVELSFIEDLKKKFSGSVNSNKNLNSSTSFSPCSLDLRVAKIISVEKHPKADKLFIEHIDLGPLGERTIVSGLAGYYEPDDLVGRNIILVANLKPAKLRGVLSEGMLLACESDDKVDLLSVPGNPGDPVVIEGFPRSPESEITIDQFFSFDMSVADYYPLIGNGRLLVNGLPVKSAFKSGKLG